MLLSIKKLWTYTLKVTLIAHKKREEEK